MKIFLAGKIFLPKGERIENVLISYHYAKNEKDEQAKDFQNIIKLRRKKNGSEKTRSSEKVRKRPSRRDK